MHAEAQVDQLNDLIFAYYKRASKSYQGIPEALSAMFLTIMELWVALDNIAGRAVKLLLNYDLGLNPDLLQLLLLSTKWQMQRLQAVEQYLVCRQQRAGGSYLLAFSNFGDPHSLAVRYVHSSRSHQALLEEITAKAERDKAANIREYEEMRLWSCLQKSSGKRRSRERARNYSRRAPILVSNSLCAAAVAFIQQVMSNGLTSRTTAISTLTRLRGRTFVLSMVLHTVTMMPISPSSRRLQNGHLARECHPIAPMRDLGYSRTGSAPQDTPPTKLSQYNGAVLGICCLKSFGPLEIFDPVLDCSGRIFSASWLYQQSISTSNSVMTLSCKLVLRLAL